MENLGESSKTKPILFIILLMVVALASVWYVKNTNPDKVQNRPLSIEGGPPAVFNPVRLPVSMEAR